MSRLTVKELFEKYCEKTEDGEYIVQGHCVKLCPATAEELQEKTCAVHTCCVRMPARSWRLSMHRRIVFLATTDAMMRFCSSGGNLSITRCGLATSTVWNLFMMTWRTYMAFGIPQRQSAL